MMSFASLTKVIPEILKSVSFHDYLRYKNYKYVKEKNFKGFHCFKKESDLFDDIIYIGKMNNEEIFYSLHYNDQGNIIDFVKNRIEIEDRYETFTPSIDHLIEACKDLIGFLHEEGPSERNYFNKDTLKEDLDELSETSFTKYYNIEPLFDFKYLNYLNIQKGVISHQIFENKIFNSRGLKINKKFHDVINVCFPIFGPNGEECGLYYENYLEDDKDKLHFEFYAAYSVKTGLWISNQLELNIGENLSLTIVDRPIEAISHFQYLKQKRKYISVFDLEEITMSHIMNIANQSRTTLYLAFNVTLPSFIKEIRILISFIKVQHDIEFLENETHFIRIRVSKSEKKYIRLFTKRMISHNNGKIKNISNILGERHLGYLESDHFSTTETDKDIFVKIPKNFKTLYAFEKMLINSFPNHITIIIEKPTHLSWKNQNKLLFDNINDSYNNYQKLIQSEEIFVVKMN